MASGQDPSSSAFVRLAICSVAADASARAKRIISSLERSLVFGIAMLPIAGARAEQDGTIVFQPIYSATPEIESSVAQETGWFNIIAWDNRGMLIRAGDTTDQCLANLSWALTTLGQLNAAEYNGAAGALTLLPTAGALLGAPTKEMWIVYKLMPLAGVLSMFLSLGGNVTPSKAGEYNPDTSFDYGGIMPNNPAQAYRQKTDTLHRQQTALSDATTVVTSESCAAKFARQVKDRADDDSGGDCYGRVWFGVFIQLCLIGVILTAMWYVQRGSIITWWCRVWGWMYFWYFIVTITSIFDNLVAAPFTKNYTMRVCKAPNNIRISDTAAPITNDTFKSALDRIEAGVNTVNRITIDQFAPSTSSRTCFYVIISVEGVSTLHAIGQIISKASTVAVYAFGTALFASSTLLSITAALMLLSLVLMSGVFGRVVAMWMASEMHRHNKPVLHTVVRSREEAAEYVQEVMDMDGLLIEMAGHVIINKMCVLRKRQWTSVSTYIGLLARPFDVVALAKRESLLHRQKWPLGRAYYSSVQQDDHVHPKTQSEVAVGESWVV